MNEYRGYNIVLEGGVGLRAIKSIGSGTLPKFLRGLYTNENEAKKRVDQYFISKESSSNVKKVSTSGD